jgi:hypothetical protein
MAYWHGSSADKLEIHRAVSYLQRPSLYGDQKGVAVS